MKHICIISLIGGLIIACVDQKKQDEDQIVKSPALTQFDQLIDLHPQSADLFLRRGQEFYAMEQYKAAIKDLTKAIDLDPHLFEARQTLADAFLQDMQSRMALETLEESVEIHPDSVHGYLKLAEFQLILKRYDEALRSLSTVQTLDPNNADAYFISGMLFKEVGDTSKAIYQFQMATRENPKLADAWINIGQLLEAAKDPEAIRYFNAGLLVAPENKVLLRALAQYLARQGDFSHAKSTYEALLYVDSDDSEAYYDLGLLYLEEDSLEHAQKHFNYAIKTDPRFARAYFYLALTYEWMMDTSQSLFYYRQAHNLNPQDQDAVDAIERLEQ